MTKDAMFIHIMQVAKGKKLLARLVRLASPPQVASLIVQILRTLPLITTPVVGLELSPEEMNVFQNILLRALIAILERFDLPVLASLVKQLAETMPSDTELAMGMYGRIGGQLVAAIVRRADACMVASRETEVMNQW